MKRPRVNDFDSRIVPKLNSSMDDLPVIESPKPETAEPLAVSSILKETQANEPTNEETFDRTTERSNERPLARTPERAKRTITRYSFEFFQDQIERLKKFSIEEQVRGEKGNMSKMVREAIDTFIATRMRTDE